MTRDEKVKKVAELEEVFQNAKGVYLADYKGMTVEVISEMRNRCRKENVRVEVAKNTLLRRAAKSTGNEAIIPYLAGPTALVTSVEDEVTPARVLINFAKEFKLPEVRGGLVAGQALSAEDVKQISALPSKNELIGLFARLMQTPLTNFASAITSPLRDLASVLSELVKQREGNA
jgi:large subunit ribosomal protein L10